MLMVFQPIFPPPIKFYNILKVFGFRLRGFPVSKTIGNIYFLAFSISEHYINMGWAKEPVENNSMTYKELNYAQNQLDPQMSVKY